MNKIIRSELREDGQSMVELALTITILMVLLAGTIDFGRAFFTWIEMRDAAQEGAAYGSLCPTDTSAIITRVSDNLNPIYTYVITPDVPNSPLISDPITVTIETELPVTMPFLGTILGKQSITIRATINDSIISSTCTSP
jgi:hypothetical protein